MDHGLIPIHFTTPPISEADGGSARLTELIAITAGLTLLHNLKLEGEVVTDCLSIVNTLQRPPSLKHHLTKTGAALLL